MKIIQKNEGYTCFSSLILLLYCCLSMTALFMPSGDLFAQSQSSLVECQPNMTVGHGPDPCTAMVYCSNSGAVESGLINCTNAGDPDG